MFTKIVATLGPATCSPQNIEKLAKLGVTVCRLNFSHGSYEVHGNTIKAIRTVQKKGYPLAIMLDTKGPEVRSGDVEKPIVVKANEKVIFTSHPTGKEKLQVIRVDYEHFAKDVKHARSILIDNGAIECEVVSIEKNGAVIARVLEDGKIGSRRHINLPGAHISLPSFTKKDWQDIQFGIDQEVDMIATSFVRTGDDIKELKAFLKKHKSDAEVMAKIETPEAVSNIEAIADAADSMMVARGDLGAEVPFEDVPMIQRQIVDACRRRGKPVLVATQMLESMITSPMPTRAEITDIAYAASLKADATMLSGETTTGLYPFKAVEAMARTLQKNERGETSFDHLITPLLADKVDIDLPRKEQSLAAAVLATKLHADAMIVMSRHGRTARAVSRCRPHVPIHTFADTESVQRKMMLVWGVIPHTIAFVKDSEKNIKTSIALLKKEKYLKKGMRVVIVSDMSSTGEPVMSIQIRTIE